MFTFNLPMSDDALSPLQVLNAEFIGTKRRIIGVTTGPQTAQDYTIISINATATDAERRSCRVFP